MFVIDESGEKLGVMRTAEALEMAHNRGVDLVMVADKAQPPVCRLMDYGKLQYEQKKKRRESSKVTSISVLKELSISLKIAIHDLETKVKQATAFMQKGHKVKFNLILKGREKSFASTLGVKQLDKVAKLFEGIAMVERKSDQLIGNRIFIILMPLKSKKVDKVEQIDKDKAGDSNAKDEDTQGNRKADTGN